MFDRMNRDSEYMSYKEFIERLRVDLDDPDFFMFDGAAPNDEDEYQTMLALFKKVTERNHNGYEI